MKKESLGSRRTAADIMKGEVGIAKETFLCDYIPSDKIITVDSTCMLTKCTGASSQEEEILFYREMCGLLSFFALAI